MVRLVLYCDQLTKSRISRGRGFPALWRMTRFRYERINEESRCVALRVKLYGNGVALDMFRPDRSIKGGGKRGKLIGKFSAASFRRLRKYCITHDCTGYCWGITLTIPGLSIVRLEYVSDWLHELSTYCNYWHIPLIWRCELQQRGQAHFHLVCYGPVENPLRVMFQWFRLVQKAGKCVSHEKVDDTSDLVWINRAFVRGSSHMFDLQSLVGDFRSWRYLVAHSSKSKQAQRGWPGRPWGVVNRSAFLEDSGFIVDLSDQQMFTLRRWVRRLTRRRINAIGEHFLLVNPATVQRMINYVDQLIDIPF